MAVLGDAISVRDRFARSANLERDMARPEPLEGYVPTARGLDVIERVATVASRGAAGGAWSVTGPYGSGKSSLGLLLDAAFGGESPLRRASLQLIDEASSPAADLLRRAHSRHGTEARGFHRAVVTATREPLAVTVTRALLSAVRRSGAPPPPPQDWLVDAGELNAIEPGTASASVDARLNLSPSTIVDAARRLAADAPLLLIIDEFGKNLEAIRDGSDADPYLLQQLAEAGQGSGLPIFIITLQHLSFEDCLAGTDEAQRREWAKVQGRFEDVSFVESSPQVRSLISSVFEVHDSDLQARINRWAASHAATMRALGVAELSDASVVASCYPLHPLSALVLPELCSRYGQHERTLFSFLAGAHRSGAASFLEGTNLPRRGLPSLGLDAVYDYFVASGALSISSARQSGRWSEIATRLRDTHGLTPSQTRTAKAVALLNLVATSGTVRASRPLLSSAGRGADGALDDLERAGVVTYRDFADEYRIWHGTDVDLGLLLEGARHRMAQQPLAEIVAGIDQPEPVVAARHSARHDVLRVFRSRYAAGGARVSAPEPTSVFDGEVLLVVSPGGGLPSVEPAAAGQKPVVAAIPDDVAALDAAAREVAATASVLDDPSVAGDRVARRELSERLAQARASFAGALADTFGSAACRWVMLNAAGGGMEASGGVDAVMGKSATSDTCESESAGTGSEAGAGFELAGGRGSAALSEAADRAYPHTPRIGNEMLNRSELTSQGAKARRLLLEAMILRGDSDVADLGFDGFGPEKAMYRAFLHQSGLHRARSGRASGAMSFGAPSDESLISAWGVLAGEFRRSVGGRVNLAEVHARLQSPPVGMKAAVVPVFVTAGLLAFRDEVAIYEHGTFTPVLSPEVSERMVRNPVHFDVKHFANTTGARLVVVRELAARLGVAARSGGAGARRVANVLAVVGTLVMRISRLDNYTRRTRSLSAEALSVRDTLAAAVEPDELLFEALPRALGFPGVPADATGHKSPAIGDVPSDATGHKSPASASLPADTTDHETSAGADGAADTCRPADFAKALCGALDELESCLENMQEGLFASLINACDARSRSSVCERAAALGSEVLDPDVRAFVLALSNDAVDSDAAWIAAVATVVARKAPAEWTDDDRRRFFRELPERLAAFHRLVALHAERRADGGGPFDALRVTLTRPDGSEYIRLVSVDARRRSELEGAVDDALVALESITGSVERAEQSLLAVLSSRLLPSVSDAEPQTLRAASDNPKTSSEPRPAVAPVDPVPEHSVKSVTPVIPNDPVAPAAAVDAVASVDSATRTDPGEPEAAGALVTPNDPAQPVVALAAHPHHAPTTSRELTSRSVAGG